MGESTWMHQHPTFAGGLHTAIVPQKSATAALVIDFGSVEGKIDRIGG